MENALAAESSPYLLQHQHNPVHWRAWNAEALAEAERLDKPIFLSIGYSTCYWCHVMEQDSFELDEVAAVLNSEFIPIKVDREERPDVDKIYMDAVVAISGHGGWPLSVFLTPQRKPFYGGTFFWKAQFLHLLQTLAQMWQTDRERVLSSSDQLTSIIGNIEPPSSDSHLNEDLLRQGYWQLSHSFDSTWGGFGGAPKFPPHSSLGFLMRMYARSAEPEALAMVETTLQKMALGGIYDHLGGGFHRYSTDAKWLVPHFEKMLYDNALLAQVYVDAFQVTGDVRYQAVARDTLQYVLREMTSPDGGFYSAQDAGEVGKEGEFYVWTPAQLKEILNPFEVREVTEVYGVNATGNFEHGTSIFHLRDWARLGGEGTPLLRLAKQNLIAHRATRTKPHLDDKVLVSWNGLMIGAMAKASAVLGEPQFLWAAQAAAQFIKTAMWTEQRLLRRFCAGAVGQPACLDDYAFLIEGLLKLYEVDADVKWLDWALDLQQTQDDEFWDAEHGGYFFSGPSDSTLIVRTKQFFDGAEPSGNSISASNLIRIAALTGERSCYERFEKLVASFGDKLKKAPTGFTALLQSIEFALDRSQELAVIGTPEQVAAFDREYYRRYLPNVVVAKSLVGQTDAELDPLLLRHRGPIKERLTLYLCESQKCGLPSNDLTSVLAMLGERKSISLE